MKIPSRVAFLITKTLAAGLASPDDTTWRFARDTVRVFQIGWDGVAKQAWPIVNSDTVECKTWVTR
jgi:hypothetical protein